MLTCVKSIAQPMCDVCEARLRQARIKRGPADVFVRSTNIESAMNVEEISELLNKCSTERSAQTIEHLEGNDLSCGERPCPDMLHHVFLINVRVSLAPMFLLTRVHLCR